MYSESIRAAQRSRRHLLVGRPVTAYRKHCLWMPLLALSLAVMFMGSTLNRLAPQWLPVGYVIWFALVGTSIAITVHLRRLVLTAKARGYRQCPYCVRDLSMDPPRGECTECGCAYTIEGLRGYWLDCRERMCLTPDTVSLERHGLGFDVGSDKS